MIPYGCQNIDESDVEEVVKVLRSDWLTQGPSVRQFEKDVASFCGAKYAVAVCNGTTALHLSYLVAGLKEGDEVIVTPNTFVATTNMILAVGAKSVFCDIRSDTYNIDETKIESLITSKTKAIVPVHFAGHPCEMNKIWELAEKYSLKVIEDGAHALGAKYSGQNIGSGKSDMVTFSFHPVKPITAGEGGMIVTDNEEYYKKLLLLRSHGIVKNEQGVNEMSDLGFNYRLTDIQSALGSSQLKKINNFLKKRHEVVSWYEKYLVDCKDVILPKELDDVYSGWHLYVIRTKRMSDRDGLYSHLLKNQVGVNFHYPAVYSHEYYRKNGYKDVELENMNKYHNTAITLPCHTKLNEENTKYISNLINDFLKK